MYIIADNEHMGILFKIPTFYLEYSLFFRIKYCTIVLQRHSGVIYQSVKSDASVVEYGNVC